MIAQNLVNTLIPALNAEDDIAKATALLDDLSASQLPVVDDSQYKGMITSDMLFDDLFDHDNVGGYQLDPTKCAVQESQHFYDVIKAFSQCNQSILAVVNEKNEYVGAIGSQDLIQAFAQTTAVQSPGSVVVISVKQIDYSLSEITRLIEADGVKVMGCFLQNDASDPSFIRVTLKLDRNDASRTVATLERFNYQVTSLFQEASVASYEKERLDALLRYLDI